jgi:hypothetical protein
VKTITDVWWHDKDIDPDLKKRVRLWILFTKSVAPKAKLGGYDNKDDKNPTGLARMVFELFGVRIWGGHISRILRGKS